ncbi:glutamine--fructose-6-phosphate transaminase (isomerizing) [Sarcina ventriculi]|uniref:Glutamine--fructose-6-phosphate aminotransferase [isomerizing] n=1 Tax=Sarcina ventriculi TaxID=1267 RepID=A0ABM9UPT1_SARVE|nr:glutamine--fructose-6-phosphate transaminase (isomerizing) [Sarcina ventriculi]CUN81770.1 Glucosamine--fructose-6-phosphate aminotransferase [isomerizing] [Sarcina ventriculi]
MCGIVGYVGEREAIEVLVNGLSKLEYRGYDSAGVAVIEDKQIKVKKCKGRLKNLETKLKEKPLTGNIGIGHTRWATHGEPSDINSHPHSNETITISVVHNGIIENYAQLKQWLKNKGYKFSSETDTEVIPNLLDYYYAGDLLDAVIKVTSKLEGSYAIGVMCNNEPDKVVAVRKDSPLIVGVGKDEYFIASDIPAILNYTRDVYYLNDKEFVVLDKKGVSIYSEDREVINKDISHITWSVDAAEKDGYEDFMLKEIHEQPKAIRDTMKSRIVLNNPINLDDIKLTKEDLDKIDRIYIVACGTAYNAGIIGKNVIEKLVRISVETDIASEFRYKDPIITKDTLVIVLSQSGETADTLAVLRDSKAKGARTIAVTNVVGSSIAREAHNVLYTWAGPEIAVASTKAYVTQLIILYSIALHLADLRETISNEEIEKIKTEMLLLPDKVQRILDNKEEIQKFASKHYNEKDMYFLGRGMDYGVAMEAALKLKEISYIHSEAYAGGELKHGTIALIEKGIVVVALFTQEKLVDKMVSNIQEVLTRGAEVLGVMCEKDSNNKELIESKIIIPDTLDILTPVLSVVPLQLFAYYVSKARGLDVDKPRNLAKSVTVE